MFALSKKNDEISTSEKTSILLKYLSMGFSIIPVRGKTYTYGTTQEEKIRNTKAPLIPWIEFQQRRATEEEIKDWLKKWPKMNVAIVTGKISNTVVVDLDSQEAVEWAE
ncbi:MAG: bifunctional DNA primase/polymerase, partial [candidate division WOR-3 bacterium]